MWKKKRNSFTLLLILLVFIVLLAFCAYHKYTLNNPSDISRHFQTALKDSSDIVIDMKTLTNDLDWDTMYIITPYTDLDEFIKKNELKWHGKKDDSIKYLDNIELLVFTENDNVMFYAITNRKTSCLNFSEIVYNNDGKHAYYKEEAVFSTVSNETIPNAQNVLASDFISPQNGVGLNEARDLILTYLDEVKKIKNVKDYKDAVIEEITTKKAWDNGLQLYRVEVDYGWLYGIGVIKDGKVMCVLPGMPTLGVYLADIDMDGAYEICTNVSVGSGIVSIHILVFDIESHKLYELHRRMKEDLYLDIGDNNYNLEVYTTKYGNGPPSKAGKEYEGVLRLVDSQLIIEQACK